ncbi:hypothetical protein R50072_30040 [Simiduia litorea]
MLGLYRVATEHRELVVAIMPYILCADKTCGAGYKNMHVGLIELRSSRFFKYVERQLVDLITGDRLVVIRYGINFFGSSNKVS